MTRVEAKEDDVDIQEKSAVEIGVEEFKRKGAYHRVRSLVYSTSLLISVVLFGIGFYIISDIRLNAQSEKLYTVMQEYGDSLSHTVSLALPYILRYNTRFSFLQTSLEHQEISLRISKSKIRDLISGDRVMEYDNMQSMYDSLIGKIISERDSVFKRMEKENEKKIDKLEGVNSRIISNFEYERKRLRTQSENAKKDAMESIRLSDSAYYFLFAIFAILMSVQIFFIRHHQKEAAKNSTLISGILRLKMIDEFSNPIAQMGVASNAFSDSSGKIKAESPVPGYPISDLTASIFNQLKTKMDDYVRNLDKKS